MNIQRERTFTITTIQGNHVQVKRRKEGLFVEGQPVAFVTPELAGTIHIFTGLPIGNRFALNRYIVSGATFWDILYDVEPTKEYAGQVPALLMQLHQLNRFLLERGSDQQEK